MSARNRPMDVTEDHLIIWLDRYIGLNNACIDLKETLANAVNLTMDEPLMEHTIDRLILNERTYHSTRELITVTTIEECLELINTNDDKKIFLITSGSLVFDIGMDYMERAIDFCHLDDHIRSLYCLYYSRKLVIRANRMFQSFLWFNLKAIDEHIMRVENLLSRHLVPDILNNISYG
ncbi:unnamed protein product [Rotaria sp. Silwood1]|nr:unnamed protein product [Rotaria sp. Silwood1]